MLGEPIGKGAHGFAFSDALAGKGGDWDWDSLSDWLANPKKFAPGTKMTFAGLSNPEDRANVIAFLNAHSDCAASRCRRLRPRAAAAGEPTTRPRRAAGHGPEQTGRRRPTKEPERGSAGGGEAPSRAAGSRRELSLLVRRRGPGRRCRVGSILVKRCDERPTLLRRPRTS